MIFFWLLLSSRLGMDSYRRMDAMHMLIPRLGHGSPVMDDTPQNTTGRASIAIEQYITCPFSEFRSYLLDLKHITGQICVRLVKSRIFATTT
jgi:hypothetical protein